MLIRHVGKTEKQLIEDIVAIHLKAFPGFFLTFMGRGFLNQMYRSYCEEAGSGLLAATIENQKTVGFLAFSGNMSGLYKHMIKKHLIAFAWYSAGAFFRKPAIFMRLLRAFLKPGESLRENEYVQLASIGVDPRFGARGVGSALIDELKRNVDFNHYAYISLETDAVDNEKTIRFYEKNGFVRNHEYATREGRRMVEFRFKP